MMKWLWLLIAIVAFAAAWQAETPGTLALCLLAGLVASVASFFGFLAARVGAVAQTQMHRETALLATHGARRSNARAGAATGGLYGGGADSRSRSDPHEGDAGTGDGGGDGGGGD